MEILSGTREGNGDRNETRKFKMFKVFNLEDEKESCLIAAKQHISSTIVRLSTIFHYRDLRLFASLIRVKRINLRDFGLCSQ